MPNIINFGGKDQKKELDLKADKSELLLKADKSEVALKADKSLLELQSGQAITFQLNKGIGWYRVAKSKPNEYVGTLIQLNQQWLSKVGLTSLVSMVHDKYFGTTFKVLNNTSAMGGITKIRSVKIGDIVYIDLYYKHADASNVVINTSDAYTLLLLDASEFNPSIANGKVVEKDLSDIVAERSELALFAERTELYSRDIPKYDVGAQSTLDAYTNDMVYMPCVIEQYLNVTVSGLTLEQGVWYHKVLGYDVSNQTQIAITKNLDAPMIKLRNVFDNKWSAWKRLL